MQAHVNTDSALDDWVLLWGERFPPLLELTLFPRGEGEVALGKHARLEGRPDS